MTIKEALDAAGGPPHPLQQKLAAIGPLEELRWPQLDNSTVESIKSCYMLWRIGAIINKALSTRKETSIPEAIANALMENSATVTKRTRDLMEADPTIPEPADHRAYPGKMDHTSVVAVLATEWADADKYRTARSGGSIAPVRQRATTTFDDSPSSSTDALWTTETGPIEVAGANLAFTDAKSILPFDLGYTRVLNGLVAPANLSDNRLSEFAAGGSLSTYPCQTTSDDKSSKLGDPVSTYFVAELTPTRALCGMSAGLHWGKPASISSKLALTTACETMASLQSKFSNTRDVRKGLLKALDAAHAAVSAEVGSDHTVVMALAAACQLDGGAWMVQAASIGFCKILLWSKSSGKVSDLTWGNAPLSRSDPGGRLGPYKNNLPDTSNLVFRQVVCAEGGTLKIVNTDQISVLTASFCRYSVYFVSWRLLEL
jgi:hypothetical protein